MASAAQSSPHTGKRELRCGVCGYGVIVEQPPPSCPICRSTAWRPLPERRVPAHAI
jgi:rubrerythrin